MEWKRIRRNVKAISPLIATLILIAITVVGGLIVYGFMAGMMGRTGTTLSVEVTSLNLVKAGDAVLASATIKNTGSRLITACTITITGDTGSVALNVGSMEPGQSKSQAATVLGELVRNPNVESGTTDPDYWYRSETGATWTTEESRSPTHSLKIQRITAGDADWRAQYFTVNGGHNYRVQGYFKGTVTSGEFFLTIRWFSNPDGTGFISENNIALATYADWTLKSEDFTAPSNAQSADIQFRAINAVGTLYGDDFSVKDTFTVTVGKRYMAKVSVVATDSSTLEKTMTVACTI